MKENTFKNTIIDVTTYLPDTTIDITTSILDINNTIDNTTSPNINCYDNEISNFLCNYFRLNIKNYF